MDKLVDNAMSALLLNVPSTPIPDPFKKYIHKRTCVCVGRVIRQNEDT